MFVEATQKGHMQQDPNGMDDERRAEIETLMADFENEARKLGCYVQGFAVADTSNAHIPDDILGDEALPKVIIMATLLVGDQAFSDRVMRPEKHEEDKEFRTLTAGADPFETLREQMKQDIEDGKNPFEPDDTDTED